MFFELQHLDLFTARSISKWEVYCCFTGLEKIESRAAAELVNGASGLIFEGLSELTAETAKELARLSGSQLSISLTGGLPLEVAAALAKHNHELFVKVAMQPVLHVQQAVLLAHAGYFASLHYPANEAPSAVIFCNPKKKISIRRYHKAAGMIWTSISASEGIDSSPIYQ